MLANTCLRLVRNFVNKNLDFKKVDVNARYNYHPKSGKFIFAKGLKLFCGNLEKEHENEK